MDSGATVKELGQELQKLTNIQEDTMRLIVPQISEKTSKLLSPFSAEHAFLSLRETSITETRSIKMMGVSANEVEQVLKDAEANLRIAGFDEEEKRLKQRISNGPHFSLILPQGPYIFCDFRTLEIPGVELNPPPSEALKRMHMLAADPGIVAIMNKHHWRVGIMTEMAPVGYVGVSPKCILGFNKNHGEEISLRLRTDDLKGFRKYESIKKTLLHELAHMVYSEHDANFYALDKQLNQEAASLDWTRSSGHTLSGIRSYESYEEDFIRESSNVPQKLGGNRSDQLISARASSVAAAYHRMTNVSSNNLERSEVIEEPDPDDSGFNEPDPDDSHHGKGLGSDISCGVDDNKTVFERKPSDSEVAQTSNVKLDAINISKEPDPDDSETSFKSFAPAEPDTSGLESGKNSMVPDAMGSMITINAGNQANETKVYKEPSQEESLVEANVLAEPDPDDAATPPESSTMQIDEPDPDDQELQRIHDPVNVVCNRLQKTLEMLRAEVNPLQTASVLQTLLKIIRNVIQHPEETKYRRLRKANPVIERNVVHNKAAMEILSLVGFNEDVMLDELGKAQAYLVLKRNDPGLLWLAKSSLESYAAC
ncbi:hypothetical protein L6164_031497 [Bauhinia variegata]|uniref:Uncharacterized protein n=1 Tax=Bauhinia variegata TaxID=167791 RepID=A0ACB9LF74_BAUVA|nr:hypothetical protein L6164_031497 [Bauhinia variegata]